MDTWSESMDPADRPKATRPHSRTSRAAAAVVLTMALLACCCRHRGDLPSYTWSFLYSTSVEWSRLIDRYPAPLIGDARPGFSPGRRVVALPVAAPRHLPDDAVPPAPSVPEAASETDAPSPFRPRVPRTPRASRLPSHLYYHKNHHHQPPPPTKPPLTPSIEK
jgi:hypothetical protein